MTERLIQSFDKLWSWETAVWIDKNTECNPERLAQLMLQTKRQPCKSVECDVGTGRPVQIYSETWANLNEIFGK